nr:type VII secretion target [Mycobacterium eburneum]
MAELEVETSALRARSSTFRDAQDEQTRVGANDLAGTESDIAAFGEINAMLHDQWRDAKMRQSAAWQSLGAAHGDHADSLTTVANGYDGTDEVNAETLRVIDTAGIHAAPTGAISCPSSPEGTKGPPLPTAPSGVPPHLGPVDPPAAGSVGPPQDFSPHPGTCERPPDSGVGATLPDAPGTHAP